jgi:hypothetical protein
MDEVTATILGFAVIFVGFPASWALIWAFVRWVKHKVPYRNW